MSIVKQPNSEANVLELLQLLDRDQSGNLTKYEFTKAMQKKMIENHKREYDG